MVQAEIAEMQAGARREAYAAVFQEITSEWAALQERLVVLEAQRPETRHALLESETERAATVLTDVDEALTAEELTPTERHGLLRRIVEDVYPEGDGYRVRLRAGKDIGQNIAMFPAHPENEAARQDRLRRWRERLPLRGHRMTLGIENRSMAKRQNSRRSGAVYWDWICGMGFLIRQQKD